MIKQEIVLTHSSGRRYRRIVSHGRVAMLEDVNTGKMIVVQGLRAAPGSTWDWDDDKTISCKHAGEAAAVFMEVDTGGV